MSFICIDGDKHMDNSRTLDTDSYHVPTHNVNKTGNFIIEKTS